MRLRSLVVPTAVALAAAVGLPAPAQAAVQCGLIMPTKVVINAPEVNSLMTLTSGCRDYRPDHAGWDLRHPGSGYKTDVDFSALELRYENYVWVWVDDEPMGRWVSEATGAATAGGTPLTQNDSVILVKYASRLVTSVARTSTNVTWFATALQWSGRSHTYVVRPRVTVGLFHQTSSSAPWTYVKSATTSSSGGVVIGVTSPKAGNYRLVVGETPTVWASYSSTIKGRV